MSVQMQATRHVVNLTAQQLSELRAELKVQRRFRVTQLEGIAAASTEPASSTDTPTRQVTHALTVAARSALSDIDAALRRLEDGTYGSCERYEAPISFERLETLPMAKLCMPCQYTIEVIRPESTQSARSQGDIQRRKTGATMSNERVDVMTTGECRELLSAHHFGRLAFVDSVGVLPSIIPVNYLLHGDDVVFRTDAGSKLAAALRGAPVAFEVDGVDHPREVGWSVVVRGHAEEVTGDDQLVALRPTPLLAWYPGPQPRYVRIKASQVIGRRIRIADVPLRWWG